MLWSNSCMRLVVLSGCFKGLNALNSFVAALYSSSVYQREYMR